MKIYVVFAKKVIKVLSLNKTCGTVVNWKAKVAPK